MIVLDASAAVELLLRTPTAAAVQARLADFGEASHAPHLIDIEVAQAIRRYVIKREVDLERGRAVLEDLDDFPLRRHSHQALLSRVWELRNNLSAYDAVYVALAEELDAPLITCDSRLAAAAGHRARIELV